MKKRYYTVLFRMAAICLALAMTFPVIAYATEPITNLQETAQDFLENPQLTVLSAKSKLSLNKSSVTITVGETVTLKATVSGKKGTVKWSSSNKSVATVSSKGVVKGKKKGTATIKAKVNGVKKTCKITVKAAPVPNVTDKVLKMTVTQAAKYLGLTERMNDPYTDYTFYYIRKGKKFDSSTMIEYYKGWEKKKGMWNLLVRDKTVSFYGVKVGMSRATAENNLKKNGWVFDEKYTDGKTTELYYNKKSLKGKYMYFSIIINGGKVKKIDYVVDAD